MSKTATISLRIEPDIKAQAEAVFSNLGITVTDAINVFLHSSIMEGGFPFQPKHPHYNQETLKVIKDAEAGKGLSKVYTDPDELYKDLGI